jgi:transposase
LEPWHDQPESNDESGDDNSKPKPEKKPRPKPKGRRNLEMSSLPRIEVEITDPELAKQGRVVSHDETRELAHFRGGFRVVVKRTAGYEIEVAGNKTVLEATQPPRLFPRSLCHTSVYAWLACQKYGLGVPHVRLEQQLNDEGESLDRGTMSRTMEDLGNTLGATIF